MVHELLVEALRPTSLDQMILPKSTRAALGDGALDQHYLFEGSPGIGKTSVARIMSQGYSTRYINVSDDSSVEVIRETIKDFCSTIDIITANQENKVKVVILDEMDGASAQFYKALRGVIEQFHSKARFIATVNDINAIPPALQSRFHPVSFNAKDEIERKEHVNAQAKAIRKIAAAQGITMDNEALREFVLRNYPDLRSMIGKIQNWRKQGITEVKIEDIKRLNYALSDVLQRVCSEPDPNENNKMFSTKYASLTDDVLVAIGQDLPNYIIEHHPEHIDKLPYIIIAAAQYQAQRGNMIDRLLNLNALAVTIQLILHSGYKPGVS